MKSKTYDKLKHFLQIVIPAAIVLIAGLGDLYGFDTKHITGTLTLLATFGGSVLGISSLQYNAKGKENGIN